MDVSAEEKRRRDLLLNGPAIGGPETKQDAIDAMFDEAPSMPSEVKPDALAGKTPEAPAAKAEAPKPAPAPKPAAKAAPQPATPAPKVEAKPKPAPAPEEANSQDDIDALFDMSPEELNKTNSQDDIDALFD